jgi:peptide chain release factor 1
LETRAYLEDPDSSMRELALEEEAAQIEILRALAISFPSLLIPPSETGSYSCLLELKSGVGGAESSLFLNDLLRMYTRFAEDNGCRTSVSMSSSEGGGLKEATMAVRGEGAYDALRWESGVHRVQRVPATESNGRVHTSTAVVIVSTLFVI